MTNDLEERLTRTLDRAATDAPVPDYDPVAAVRRRQRRRKYRRAALASACAVAIVAVSAVTAARLTGSPPDPGRQYTFSPDRIPDFSDLPEPQKLWPKAVHRLPGTLPDGAPYDVVAVLGNDRYLVTRGLFTGEAAPSVFDTKARTVTELGAPEVSDGLARARVLMAREINGQAVWFLEGSRNSRVGREAWAAPLDGGPARLLADLPDGSAPRFSQAGNAIIWEYDPPGKEKLLELRRYIRTVSLSGGPVVDVPNSQGFVLADLGPWITNQQILSGIQPKTSGELRNVVTGERLRWQAADDIQYLRCGPTWCTGTGSGDRIALQSLDGSNRTELPYRGSLEQTNGGRLATGSLELPTGTLRFFWDRTTGRAAAITASRQQETRPAGSYRMFPSLDVEPAVVTLRSSDNELVVLDLTAIE